MSALQVMGIAIGVVAIALVLWNIRGRRKHGDGKVETFDHQRNTDWMGDGF